MEATVSESPAPGKPIATPPEFPVRWEDPKDARMFWEPDPMHYPDPMTPLEFEFLNGGLGEHGFNHAAEHYELPVRMRELRINTYYYASIYPIAAPPEPVIKVMKGIGRVAPGLIGAIEKKAVGAQAKKYLQKMEPVIARLMEYWEMELLPEVKEHLAYWEGYDLRGASMPELLSYLDETEERAKRLGEVHFLVALPMLLAMSRFDDLYRDLFGAGNALEAYKLLQGFDNKSLEVGRELWKLSRRALRSPAVLRVLEENAAGEVIPELEKTTEGRAFLAELRAYLDGYGQRGDKFSTIGDVSWIEDPAPVIKNLKDYVTQPDCDPEAELASLAAEREQLVAGARERLEGYPAPVVEQFEVSLRAAQEGTVLQEDHGFWIDFKGMYRIRKVLQEFGRRFVEAGVIGERDDVLYLTLDELRETAGTSHDRRGPVRERMAEMDRFRAVKPPPVGRMPLDGPPDDPLARTIGKFFGAPRGSQGDPDILVGNAGSPGTVRGPAKVVRSLAEADKLESGDILVAETTAPPWTPLFATAAAIVTDTGGVLSHCAVVAREYRIPAVVGTGSATATIQDGQLLEVDGDTGTVRVVR